jgi:cytochrome d ubiquinol oxidase subunit II
VTLPALWFGVICALWSAYFITVGFDFGVGMLVPWLGRREPDRAAMFGAIGPVWDGNEVWLLIAGGATFAAFPQWYATMFSGFYVALLLVLVMLIVRVVSFEWRTKSDDHRWRGLWTWINVIASYGAPLVWGVGLSALLFGTPIDAHQEFAGSFWSLLSWYSLIGGLALVVLCAAHGAVFLSLRTAAPELRDRALAVAGPLSVAAVVCGGAYLVATLAVGVARNHQDVARGLPVLAAGLATAIAALVCIRLRRPAAAFVATALTIGLAVVLLFVELYPRVMVSSTDFTDSLTVANSSSAHYTLTVMTVATALLLPVVAVYQVWIYRVFRVRVAGNGARLSPADVIAPTRGPDDNGRGDA